MCLWGDPDTAPIIQLSRFHLYRQFDFSGWQQGIVPFLVQSRKWGYISHSWLSQIYLSPENGCGVVAGMGTFTCLLCPSQACLVPTTETVRVRYFMDRLLERQRPVMLVGNAGTGKSVLVGDKLSSLDTDAYVVKKVPFNYYTTSAMLQGKAPAESQDFCLAGYQIPGMFGGVWSGVCTVVLRGRPVGELPLSFVGTALTPADF